MKYTIPLVAALLAVCLAGCMIAKGPLFLAVERPTAGPVGGDPLPCEIYAFGRAGDRPAGPDTINVSIAVCFEPPPSGLICDTVVDLGDTTARFVDLLFECEEILCRAAGGDTLHLLRRRFERFSECDSARTRACKRVPGVNLDVPRAVNAIDIETVVAWRLRADSLLVRRFEHGRRYRRVDERRLVPVSR